MLLYVGLAYKYSLEAAGLLNLIFYLLVCVQYLCSIDCPCVCDFITKHLHVFTEIAFRLLIIMSIEIH